MEKDPMAVSVTSTIMIIVKVSYSNIYSKGYSNSCSCNNTHNNSLKQCNTM